MIRPRETWILGLLSVWSLVMASVFEPRAIPVIIACLGWWLTRVSIARLTPDPVCRKLALWSYLFKILLTGVLFIVSYHQWPLLQSYQGERGFWVFAEDALAYHNHGHNLVLAWKGLAPFPQTDISNWSFIVYMGGLYRVFGSQPLVVSCLNAWFGTVIVGAGLVMLQRLALSPGAVRLGVALLGFWPSLLLWSSQSMKDPLLLALTLVGLCLLLELLRARTGADAGFFWFAGLLGLALAVLVLFRDYTAIQLCAAGSAMMAGLAVRLVSARSYRMAIRLFAAAALIPLAVSMAGRLDVRKLVVWPTRFDVVATSPPAPAPLLQMAPPAAPPVAVAVSEPAPSIVAAPLAVQPREPIVAQPPLLPTARNAGLQTLQDWWKRIQAIPKSLDDRRSGFLSTGGYSLMDAEVRFRTLSDVVEYLPNSLGIALLSPFPWQWFDVSGRTRAFRIFTALEALLMYVLLAGFLLRVPHWRRYVNVQTGTVLLFVVISAIPMCLVVANLGTLFRLRLQFVLPLIVLLCGADVWSGYRQVMHQLVHGSSCVRSEHALG